MDEFIDIIKNIFGIAIGGSYMAYMVITNYKNEKHRNEINEWKRKNRRR